MRDLSAAEDTVDLEKAVELLRRCEFHLSPNRLDPIAGDVQKYLAAYDEAYKPEETDVTD